MPLRRRQPQRQPDEILASLDRDTRRPSCMLLLEGGAEGLGEQRRGALRRVPPVRADRARHRQDQRRPRLAAREHRALDPQLPHGQPRSSARGHPARRVRRLLERRARRRSRTRRRRSASRFQELPSTLRGDARTALASGDSSRSSSARPRSALIPAARALGPALREVRPFFRADGRPDPRPDPPVHPPGAGADPATVNTGEGAQQGDAGADERRERLNSLFNALAFNPPGPGGGLPVLGGLAQPQPEQRTFQLQDAHGAAARAA